MIRIRSEHAIGFLKGRFQSLKGLRINIIDEDTHKFATYWVVSCIGIHGFAMKCEAEERAKSGVEEDVNTNDFILAGLSSDSDSDANVNPRIVPTSQNSTRRGRAAGLAAGKARREQLKATLFEHKRQKEQRRRPRQESDSD